MIVIAVAAVIVTYAWVMTFTTSTTDQVTMLTVENVRFHTVSSTDYVEIIVRNSGTSDAKIVEVYAGTSSTALATQSSVIYTPITQMVSEGSSLNVTIQMGWDDGTRYHFKMATDSGLTLPFSEVA